MPAQQKFRQPSRRPVADTLSSQAVYSQPVNVCLRHTWGSIHTGRLQQHQTKLHCSSLASCPQDPQSTYMTAPHRVSTIHGSFQPGEDVGGAAPLNRCCCSRYGPLRGCAQSLNHQGHLRWCQAHQLANHLIRRGLRPQLVYHLMRRGLRPQLGQPCWDPLVQQQADTSMLHIMPMTHVGVLVKSASARHRACRKPLML